MGPNDLVAKYIVNRAAVLQRPDSFDALTDFGRSKASIPALEHGAKYLKDQLYGENLVFLVAPDTSKKKLDVLFNVSSMTLNGQDARKIREGVFEEGEGIIWRSYDSDRLQLVKSDLQKDGDYLEFSRTTKGVYAVPIRSYSGPLGVFCIDSSDVQNFSDQRILLMIHNFVELILISLLNSEIAKLSAIQMKTEVDMTRSHEVDSIRQAHSQHIALAITWPIGPTVLRALSTGQRELQSLSGLFPSEDILGVLLNLQAATLITYSSRSFKLTETGSQLINKINNTLLRE